MNSSLLKNWEMSAEYTVTINKNKSKKLSIIEVCKIIELFANDY